MKLLMIGALLAGVMIAPAHAQDSGKAEVTPAERHDVLPSLRDVVPQKDGYSRWHFRAEHMIPLPVTPPGQIDGAVQSTVARGRSAPSVPTGVDGVGNGFTGPAGSFSVQWAPPDTVGAVGATQYVQIVNSGLAVFDKATQAVVYGPVPTNTPWVGFGGACEADNDGDAVVVYDKTADRWIISQFAVAAKPYFQCVAVSQTSDATGAYNRYAFLYGKVFPDYPKMGVWPDGYYETFNMFNGNRFVGSNLCAYDRASMLAGINATQQCFQLSTSFGGVLPADLDGSAPPPAGAPNYMVNFGANSLNLWKFHVDWANPANTTLSTPVNIPVAAFTPACSGAACVPQSGTPETLDSLADRLMFRLAYRNFGSYEALVVNHSVTVGSNANPYSGVRWYELRSPGTTPVVFQQSTFSPDTSYRWMGSVAMDGQGNMALGYSVSSDAMFPAIRYTGRQVGDPLSTMQAETSIIEGGGSQTQGLDRWGDYSAMTIDPVDDCTFWFTSEYLKANGTFNWSTRIASFKFAGCVVAKQDQTISFTSTPPAAAKFGGTYAVAATATSGRTVTFSIDAASASVCSISGSQVSFIGVGACAINANQAGNIGYNPAPQVQQSFAVGPASQSINFTSSAPASAKFGGTYNVTATATSGLTVTFAIDGASSTVCSLAGSQVSFIGVGTCTINADQGGNANYNAAPQNQQSFAVGKANQTVNFTSTAPLGATVGGPQYTVTAQASSALPVALSIDASSSAVCAIDASGSGSQVSFIGAGTCKINANQVGNGNYNAAPQAQQSFAVVAGTPTLVFTAQPAAVTAGGVLGTIAVTEKNPLGDTIDDNASVVTFTITACGGPVALGSAAMVHGVATLDPVLHFYTVTDPTTLEVTAKTAALTASSNGFVVQANGDLAFADGFEGCRL
ncbi:MAG TPA: hypothetical protein VFE67_08430 [Rudaea sp.]|jgi:hypothetical protein|nr:hypothetical protein [Rudaea sp.]